MPNREDERRQQIRVAASFEVRYQSIDELVVAYTENLSKGGVFVRTDDVLPVGAVVQIALDLPDDGPELTAFARVAHISRGNDGARGMGLELIDVGGAYLGDRITRFLAAAGHDTEVPPSPAAVSARVVVVDGDEAWRVRAAQAIREAGHRAESAKNGLDALGKAVASRPDLIVTEIDMPALDGWQLIRLVRERATLADVPIIVCNAGLSDEERLRAYQLGVSAFVRKPFEPDELALCVQRVVEHARAYPRKVASGGSLRGELDQVSLARVLTLLAAEKRTGVLLVVGAAEVATLSLRDGDVVRVELPAARAELEGAERLFHVMDWHSGHFEFTNGDVSGDDEIGLPVPQAILQHSQRGDSG